MHDNIVNIKRSCGSFTKVKGSNTYLHYTQAFPNSVLDQTELWELTTVRMLRYAYLDGTIQEFDIDRKNLPIMTASIIASFANNSVEKPVTVYNIEPGWGTELEAVKLIVEVQKSSSNIESYIGFFVDNSEARTADNKNKKFKYNIMHDEFEHFRPKFSVLSFQSSLGRILTDSRENSSNNILFFNCFKKNEKILPELIKNIDRIKNGYSMFLIVFRATREAEKDVININTKFLKLPNLYNTLHQFTEHGWHTEYAFMPDLDRDFLLPFDGDYGVCIVYGALMDSALPKIAGFSRYAGKSDHNVGTNIALSDGSFTKTYEDLVRYRLPEFQLKIEHDWQSWASKREWDPSNINWGGVADEVSSDILILKSMSANNGFWNPSSDEKSRLGHEGKFLFAMSLFGQKRQSLAWQNIYEAFDTSPSDEKAYEYAVGLMASVKGWTTNIDPNYTYAVMLADRLAEKPNALFYFFTIISILFITPERFRFNELFFLEHMEGLFRDKDLKNPVNADRYLLICGLLAAVFFISGNIDSAKRYMKKIPLNNKMGMLNAMMYLLLIEDVSEIREILRSIKNFIHYNSNAFGIEQVEVKFLKKTSEVFKQRTGQYLFNEPI